MSSVTRLHLLSQSMLNVSCQKQKHRGSLPTDSLAESPMEFVGQPRPSGACSFLGVPGLSTLDLDVDDDEGEVVIGIRPKSSPLPRRRSSVCEEDSEPEPPPSGSRRVSFADAKGLCLVQVKEFDTWDIPKLPGYDSSDKEGKVAEEYFLSPLNFSLSLSSEELLLKVQEQKVELETIELLPGTTILKGAIRVLNISFIKAVYIRTTLDAWSSHFDLLAEYMPGCSDSLIDCFSFKLTLVPPFGEQGARVDFCLRYETPVGTFWANNNNRNYVLFCHQKERERTEKPQKEHANKKSCLKTVGQDFAAVESVSAAGASSQENLSPDVSKHEEKVDTVKSEQISDSQTGTSEEDGQKLLVENRRNRSRRNRRRAARMARVRDHFALKDGGANGSERDESPPEANQAAQEETPEQRHSHAQSFSEGGSKSEESPLVSESVKTCSKAVLDVAHDTSPAHDCTPSTEPEKSESTNLADSATLTGGESATDIPDNPLHSNDDPASAERQTNNMSVFKAEESSQKQGTSDERAGNVSAESADSVVSAVSSESLVSKTTSFTFGTVVAPLYHQVFGRVASESQSGGDPVQATLNAEGLTQSSPHSKTSETSCVVQTGAGGEDDNIKGNVIKSQESKQECLDVTPNSPLAEEDKDKEEETSVNVTPNDNLDHAETVQDPILHSYQRCTNTSEVPEAILGDTAVHPLTVNILNTDISNIPLPTESLSLQGEAQEDNLTSDLQSQTTADTTCTCIQINTNLHEICAESETKEVLPSQESSFISLQDSKYADESNKDNEVSKTATVSVSNGILENNLLEVLHDLDTNQINNSATNRPENINESSFEIVDETDVKTPLISLGTHKETNSVEEENKEETMNTFMEHKDEGALKSEDVTVLEEIELHETEAVVSNYDGTCLAGNAEVKNWEMMVEEEEENILTDEEEVRVISSKAGDTEAVEKDQGEQVEDAGIETSENKATTETETENTEEEMLAIIAAREKTDSGDADASEGKRQIGEEQIGESVAGNDREEPGNELEYVQATEVEKTAEKTELGEELKVEKGEKQLETEVEDEKPFTEIQGVTFEMINAQGEEEIDEEEKIEIVLVNDSEAGVGREDQVQPKEENVEEENLDYKEDVLVDETGESESESMIIENSENKVGCVVEGFDIIQNKVEGGLSAPVNNVQDSSETGKENTAEGRNAHIQDEMHAKEKRFQSTEDGPNDLSEAMRDEIESAAAEGVSCIFTDEPECDSTSTESDSDDEVELYMHCLRAVHTGAQGQKDLNKDTGFNVGKRPSISRSKLLTTPMPSISESLDEEQHLSHLQDNHEDMEASDVQPIAAAPPVSSESESINRNVSWWIETFSCSNISKTLLYATLFVVFAVVAYHYDFLACFGLYLISVIWLCCQGERQTVKSSSRMG